MASVSLKNITKTFQRTEVLHDVSLDISDGEFLVVVGPSGCGKSTLLRLLAGLEETTRGEISIGGRAVNRLPPAEREIAMVFQDYALYPHMTVEQNMSFGLKLRGLPAAEIRRRVQEAAQTLQIEPLLLRTPKQLSGGQRQRVAIGRAIVRHPKVFLFDEPLSNLDAKLREEMRVEIAKLHLRLKTTVVYVTHDQVEAMTLAGRIAVLNAGRVQQIDAPREIFSRPANLFVAGFIGSPTMNFVDGELAARGEGWRFSGGPITLNIAHPSAESGGPGAAVLGVRPESILVREPQSGGAPITGTVEVAELLGHRKHLHLDVGGRKLMASVEASVQAKAGDSISIWIAGETAHLFDKKTGLRLN